MAESYIVDTNVLVRFLTGQPPDMAEDARALVAAADSGEVVLEVLPLIVAETVYTLESFYGMDRRAVASKLKELLQSRGMKPHERDRVLDALQRHHDVHVHFADAYLAASAAETKLSIASFDHDLDKFRDISRVEPGARK